MVLESIANMPPIMRPHPLFPIISTEALKRLPCKHKAIIGVIFLPVGAIVFNKAPIPEMAPVSKWSAPAMEALDRIKIWFKQRKAPEKGAFKL